MWTTLVDVPFLALVKLDVNHTIVDRHYRSNQSLAGLVERIIERITVHCSPVSLIAPTASNIGGIQTDPNPPTAHYHSQSSESPGT